MGKLTDLVKKTEPKEEPMEEFIKYIVREIPGKGWVAVKQRFVAPLLGEEVIFGPKSREFCADEVLQKTTDELEARRELENW
jgi:hypothetical protein